MKKNILRSSLFFLVFLMLMTNCSAPPKSEGIESADQTILPPNNLEEAPATRTSSELGSEFKAGFLIGPGNVLEINVLGEPELSLSARVTESGVISYPLLGQVEVQGLTPMQLERHLETLLGRDYLVSPRVTIFIQEYGKISVLGQVKKPGAYGYREQLTVTGALALGGGMTDIAAPNNTQVIRSTKKGKTVFRIRVGDIFDEGEEEGDLLLQPGDIVFVPESFF